METNSWPAYFSFSSSRFVRVPVWLVCVCLASVGCGSPKPILPPPPNDFVSTFVAERIDDSLEVSPLEDEIEIREGDGFFVQFGLQYKEQLPTEFEKLTVVPPEKFSMMVVIYPRDSDASDSRTLRSGVPRLFRRDPLDPYYYLNQGQCAYWYYGGISNKNIPVRPVSQKSAADWKAGKSQWYWSYLCVDKDQSGEFIFEVWLLPTARWLSPARIEYGSPVVLKRGLLRVIPAAG